MPLAQLIGDDAIASGADSAIRAYRALRTRYFGRDAYDFGEFSLNAAARRVALAGRHEDALAILRVNEELFPQAASVPITWGNVLLMRGDTTGAAGSFRTARAKDSTNFDARSRRRDIGRQP